MVSSEAVKALVPNVKRNIPGGGSVFWRICSRGVIGSTGLLCRGFLKLQRNVRVDGMDNFLKILESKRDRSVITGVAIAICC